MRAALPIAATVACALIVGGAAHAAGANLDPKLRAFLRAQFTNYDTPGFETRVAVARTSLAKEGPAVFVVYLMGNAWCGSGGCTLALIQSKGGAFQVVSQTPIVQLPVKVLPSRTNGWNDLSVGVGGGGAKPGFAKLTFNGKRYAGNPSMSARVPASQGAVLISEDDQGVPLSP